MQNTVTITQNTVTIPQNAVYMCSCLTMAAELIKSKFSVLRRAPVGVAIISGTDFFHRLVGAPPGRYARTEFLKKKNFSIFYGFFFLSFSLTWDPMGAKISKGHSYTHKLQPKEFQIAPDFFPKVHHKTTFGMFKILESEIVTMCFSFSLTWGPKGVKISKRYPSYKSQRNVFKGVLNFPPNDPHKPTFGDF